MRSLKRLGLALFLSSILPVPLLAQASPTSTWSDSVTFRDPIERSVDIQRAEAQQRARNNGFGPAQVVTTYEGDVTFNETNEYRGTVNNSSATTATNLNTLSTTVRQEGSGNTAGVTFTTGNSAYGTSQNATVANAQTSNGSANNNVVSDND